MGTSACFCSNQKELMLFGVTLHCKLSSQLNDTKLLIWDEPILDASEHTTISPFAILVSVDFFRQINFLREYIYFYMCFAELPQFLYDAGFCRDGKIIGTAQPWRGAAVTVATRGWGMQWWLGGKGWILIRFDDVASNATRIKYMTDGLLLR